MAKESITELSKKETSILEKYCTGARHIALSIP